jgi:hypothetical protein
MSLVGQSRRFHDVRAESVRPSTTDIFRMRSRGNSGAGGRIRTRTALKLSRISQWIAAKQCRFRQAGQEMQGHARPPLGGQ